MTLLLFSIIIFLSLIQWIVFIDVILSWGSLIGIRFRPNFITSITNPLYEYVRRYIPSSFSGIDFAPIIIYILIEIITKVIIALDPSVLLLFP